MDRFSDRQLATILAALRYWQQDLAANASVERTVSPVCAFTVSARQIDLPERAFNCFGLLDRSNQGDVPNLLRSDTPPSMKTDAR